MQDDITPGTDTVNYLALIIDRFSLQLTVGFNHETRDIKEAMQLKNSVHNNCA